MEIEVTSVQNSRYNRRGSKLQLKALQRRQISDLTGDKRKFRRFHRKMARMIEVAVVSNDTMLQLRTTHLKKARWHKR